MLIRDEIKEQLITNATMVAKIALYLQDPYGDGIRLDVVRHPSLEYQAARRMATTKVVDMFDREVVINAFLDDVLEHVFGICRQTNPELVRNGVISRDEALEIGMLRQARLGN